MKFFLMMSEIKAPQYATQAEIEKFCNKRGYRIEVMTDQIDIYRGRRRIVTYMIG